MGVSVVLSLLVSVFATWLTSPKGVIPADSPAGWLIARWPVTLLIAACFLLLALLTGVLSRWPAQVAVPLASAEQNRDRMLQRLRRSYEDILVQSLQGVAWMELGLARQLDVVQNAATLLLRLSHRVEQLLPPGTPIMYVYEEAAHELLILGQPGAGKSTLLLQLAQQLVEHAEQDDRQPLPVLLPLSSWAVARPTFQDWLSEQVAQTYDIPQQLARRWVEEEQLLPLLDGLDEMDEEARPSCIVAINTYHHAHPGPLVVCSRSAEYEEAAKHHRLSLQSAVVVQPLPHKQVRDYLTQAGKSLEALRRALNKNSALQELASTPLMLSVLMLTYQGTPVRSLPQKEAELLQQVWRDYTQRMVERKGDGARYPLERIRSWLHWQAQQMQKHNQTVFYLEHLQPDWLPTEQLSAYIWLAIRIPGMLIGVLASISIILFLNSFRYFDFVSMLQIVVLGGFLGGLFSETAIGDTGRQSMQSNPRHAFRRMIIERTATSTLVGLLYGLCFGLYLSRGNFGPSDWLWVGSISGVVIGLCCWLLLALVPRFSGRDIRVSTNKTQRWLRFRQALRAWHGQQALLVAIVFGVAIPLITLLINIRYYGLSIFIFDVIYLLGDWISGALVFGITSALVSQIFEVQKGDVFLTERLRWTWKSLIRSLLSPRHLRMTLMFASIVLVLLWLSYGIRIGYLDSPTRRGLSAGLLYGLGDGLISGLSVGLSYWLLIGLLQGISNERVEDRDRRVFNQGIRRSFRNSGIMGIIGGAVIGASGALSTGLSAGLNGSGVVELNYAGQISGLYVNPGYGLQSALFAAQDFLHGNGWLLAVSGGLLLWASNGGLAIIRHAVLRLLLRHMHAFPWRAEPFLEDAKARILMRRVGGGYSFMHRLLLDYFV